MNVWITGASGGIGGATARLFAQNGYGVAVHFYHNAAAARDLADSICAAGGRAVAVGADVADSGQISALLQTVERTLGGVDVLVNNAGIAQQKLFPELSDDDCNRMLDVNLKGVIHCTRAVLPQMIRRKRGSVVNVSSMWGVVGASCEAHYSAAKAGVIGLTKALAKEVGPSGVRVNCIAPGVIDTEMNAALTEADRRALAEQTPLGRMGRPEEIAAAIYFLATMDFVTGQVLTVDGGFTL